MIQAGDRQPTGARNTTTVLITPDEIESRADGLQLRMRADKSRRCCKTRSPDNANKADRFALGALAEHVPGSQCHEATAAGTTPPAGARHPALLWRVTGGRCAAGANEAHHASMMLSCEWRSGPGWPKTIS
mgnify:CR=1 FL=1